MTAKGQPPVPTGKGKRWWKKLSHDEQLLHTDWRFEAGHRNSEVMETLGLSVGTVAGLKRRWSQRKEAEEVVDHTPTATHTQPKPVQAAPAPPEPPAAPARPKPRPPAARVQELPTMQPKPHVADMGHRWKKLPVASSEKTQCDHEFEDDKRRCALVATVFKNRDEKYCENHAHLH